MSDWILESSDRYYIIDDLGEYNISITAPVNFVSRIIIVRSL